MGSRFFLGILSALCPLLALAESDSQSLKSAAQDQKPQQYSIPLGFTPEDLNLKVQSYKLEWDLSRGSTLQMGPVIIDSGAFVAAFFNGDDNANHLKRDVLLAAWPTDLFPEGRLELITKDGSIVWSEDFNPRQVREWNKFKGKLSSQNNASMIFQNSNLGFQSLTREILEKQKSPFRFCLTQTFERERSMLCSVRYVVDRTSPHISLAQIKEQKEPRVFVDQAQVDQKGSMSVQTEQIVNFFAETSTGAAYEFIAKVPAPEIIDIVRTEGNQLLLRGFPPFPVGAERALHSNEQESVWNKIGWQQTIGDLRSRWTYKGKSDEPLALSGAVGGIFILRYEAAFLPQEQDRLWLSSDDVLYTYSSSRALRLFKGKEVTVKAVLPSEVRGGSEKPQEVTWDFYAPHLEAYNRSSLIVENGVNSFKTSLEIYRGYSSELSGRLTMAADTQAESLLMGEISYNQWFQSLFGWENSQWSVLRWGISAKYFKSLTQYSITSLDTSQPEKSDVGFINFSAKYRFSPGLWGRHETWGAMLDYQSIDASQIKGSLLGAGVFWARSMPRIFDNWLNYASFFRYPKFVDMELLYYPTSLSSSVDVSGAFMASFHGKIFWTKTVFGEAGFALKSLNLEDKESGIRYSLNLFSVTAGLGVNF